MPEPPGVKGGAGEATEAQECAWPWLLGESGEGTGVFFEGRAPHRGPHGLAGIQTLAVTWALF